MTVWGHYLPCFHITDRPSQPPPAGKNCYGVDLNRNWDVVGYGDGASSNECSEIYKVPHRSFYPFLKMENININFLFQLMLLRLFLYIRDSTSVLHLSIICFNKIMEIDSALFLNSNR